MTPIVRRPAVPLLVTAGFAFLLLAVPLAWPGFAAWPAHATTLTPADTASQTFALEFDQPLLVEFPVTISASQTAPEVTAQVSVLSPSPVAPAAVPASLDASLSRLQVPLAAIEAHAGATLRVVLSDASEQVWIASNEHDTYPTGERLVGEQTTGGDLAFRLIYRRTLADLLLQGLGVARQSWRLIAAAALSLGAAGVLVMGALRRIEGLDLAARLSAAIGGGLLLTTLVGWAAAVARLRFSAAAVALAAVATAAVGLFLLRRAGASMPRFDRSAAGLVACLLVFGLLRLAFAAPLSLPPHIDGVEHYAVVTDLLAPGRAPVAENSVTRLTTQYYHFGFHGLAAWVLSLAGTHTPWSLIVLGQLLQAAALGAIYFPMVAASRDPRAALAAVVLAGVGWSMPAHASNWSRYPALLSLAITPMAAGLLILAWRSQGKARFILLAAAGLAAVGVTLAHTRLAFLVLTLLLAIEGANRLLALTAPRGRRLRNILPVALGAAVVMAILWTASPFQFDSAWQALTKTAAAPGALSALLVLCLAPFALWRYRAAALATVLWTVLILLLAFIPPNASYPFPLLDEPMVRLVLFLPVSALGGLGVSGLCSALDSPAWRLSLRRGFRLGLACLGALYLAWALHRQSLAPSDCCLIAGADDAAVAQEASKLLGPAARLLIPSQAQVNYSPRGVDGGAWLLPLNGLQTVLWPASAELSSPAEHDQLCSLGISHVYVGSTALSYTREELDFAGAFYSPAIIRPNASLYAVVGCDLSQP